MKYLYPQFKLQYYAVAGCCAAASDTAAIVYLQISFSCII